MPKLPKVPTPRHPWQAAFFLDVLAEILHGGLFNAYTLVLAFFFVSTFVVGVLWVLEAKIRRS